MGAWSRAWGLILLGAALPVAAQEAAEVEGLRRRVEEQSRALEDLRREVERLGADPAPTSSASSWTDKVRVGTFWIESADGDHRLALHARLHLDARFDLASDFFDDTFQVRRARVEVDGRVFRKVEYKLGLEFGRTQGANLRDAWIKLVPLEAVQLWAGQMLLPFSTERLTSSNVMKHPERPIIVADLLESRDIGVMLHGILLEGLLRYSAGIYNGNGQNQRVDNDDDKDLVGRLELLPAR